MAQRELTHTGHNNPCHEAWTTLHELLAHHYHLELSNYPNILQQTRYKVELSANVNHNPIPTIIKPMPTTS